MMLGWTVLTRIHSRKGGEERGGTGGRGTKQTDLVKDWFGLWTALVLRLGFIRRLDFCFIPSLVQRLLDLLRGGLLCVECGIRLN